MTSIFTDYGYWDGKTEHFKPTATPTSAFADQFIYTIQRELETARIALDRISYAGDRAKAFDAQQEQLQGVIDAARDVELAVAGVIAKLTQSEPSELKPVGRTVNAPDRVIKTADFSKVGNGEAA